MKMLMMLTGLAARLLRGASRTTSTETEGDGRAVDAEAALGGCYHDGVAYSLGYDANGSVELCGKTFTTLGAGVDGGALAALRRHRQNFDSSRDVERFIVALRPVRVVSGVVHGAPYGLDPGPLAGSPPTAEVGGEHVAKGRVNVVERAMERVRRDCERRGIDISKSTVTISVRPRDGQEAFARCEPVERGRACDKCCSPYCECDGSCVIEGACRRVN